LNREKRYEKRGFSMATEKAKGERDQKELRSCRTPFQGEEGRASLSRFSL
jgi:hypothetical protein